MNKWGVDYFEGTSIKIYSDRDKLTSVHGVDIKLIHTPGHDEGQMSIYPEDLSWMIVSDLIQTVGTVVIGAPEGDMGKYFNSLNEVIQMNPKVILPSHGIGIGGVDKIKVTLEHRKMREKQVMKFLEEGKSFDEMLPLIYPGLEVGLVPYAKKQFSAHLKKLKTISI